MLLSRYLEENNLNPDWIAHKARCSEQAIYKYLRGDRIPRVDVMQRIHAATDGAVTANDFYGIRNTSDIG